jgi:hypothetical protein
LSRRLIPPTGGQGSEVWNPGPGFSSSLGRAVFTRLCPMSPVVQGRVESAGLQPQPRLHGDRELRNMTRFVRTIRYNPWHTALHYSALYCIAQCCTTLHCTALHCTIVAAPIISCDRRRTARPITLPSAAYYCFYSCLLLLSYDATARCSATVSFYRVMNHARS